MLQIVWNTDAFMYALIWMLIHSIWQALIAAAIAGLAIHFGSMFTASRRYNFLLALFGCIVAAACSTFFYCYQDYQQQTVPTIITSSQNVQSNILAVGLQQPALSFPLMQKATYLINENNATLLGIWLAVMLLKTIGVGAGLSKAMMLRKKANTNASQHWQQRFQSLINKLGINYNVQLHLSKQVMVPMVIGHLKPVVLVPISFFTNLPPADIEAILIHELAHIKRCDYLVNLLQRLIETIFFFNLPLLWLSAQIRTEREHCCDDIAIAHSENIHGYVNALVSIQQLQLQYKYAPAFSGSKTPLLDRIKRLIYQNNKTLSTMEKITLTAGILATTLLAFAFNQKPASTLQQETTIQTQKAIGSNAPKTEAQPQTALHFGSIADKNVSQASLHKSQHVDTSGKGNAQINTYIDGKLYKVVFAGDKVVEMYVDGVQIPEQRFGEYDTQVKTLLAQKHEAELQAQQAKEEAKKAQEEARAAAAQAKLMQDELAQMHTEIQHAKHNAELAKREAAEHAKLAKVHAAKAQEHAKWAQVHAAIFKELQKDGLIGEHETNLNYSIKDGKLYINGKEQPVEVYRKYEKLMEEEKKRLDLQ